MNDNEETKVPLANGRWPNRPTRKGMYGRSWKWYLPKTLFGRILLASFLPACAVVVILAIWKG